ncbi:hypothetical protein A2335_01160 [Candidatus Peregrinibacteria bacterium RIFOXYB2_FULL_32_7]|nr:MAG: hypothetical protein A2335_01160 [Candidatus Peregrinibacteria bacterium RIFOXYB2_FULL_32_7]
MADAQANPMGSQQNIKVEEGQNMVDLYVNAVSANITTNEVTLQLGVTKPGGGAGQPVVVKLLGNLYLSHATAISTVNLLQNALKAYEEKVKQAQTSQQSPIPQEGSVE